MRVIDEAFTKQLFHNWDGTISSGMHSYFTVEAALSGIEQVSVGWSQE
jgi:hypothetical protein